MALLAGIFIFGWLAVIFSVVIRIGNIVIELRKLNAKFDKFMQRFPGRE
jgi:hypothetical protein